MGVFSRFERKLEHGVGSAFARVFKGKVHPAEIARALQQDADSNRTAVDKNRTLVPNSYTVRLGGTDYDHLHEWERQLARSLSQMCREHFDEEGWSTYGAIKIRFERDDALRTGVFEIESRVDDAQESLPPGRYDAAIAAPPVGLAPQTIHAPRAAPAPPAPPRPAVPPVPPVPPPAPPRPAPVQPALKHQIIIDGPNTRVVLAEGSNVVGRGSAAHVRVTDTGVSRAHAEIVVRGPVATVSDLQSTNGTLVNGRRVTRTPLRHGDVIRLGRSVLVYRYEPEGSR